MCAGPEGSAIGTINSEGSTQVTTLGGDLSITGVDGSLTVLVNPAPGKGRDPDSSEHAVVHSHSETHSHERWEMYTSRCSSAPLSHAKCCMKE